MKPWNQAAWKQNTYRSEKPRVMHAPVGSDWPGRAEMLAKAQAAHTARQDAEDAARGLVKPASAGNRPAPQPVIDSILTVSDVAKLPVGTRVVVVDSVWIPRAVELRITCTNAGSFGLVSEVHGSQYHMDLNDVDTFRRAEPAKPALLTLAEAKAAVDAGKAVRCVDGWDKRKTFVLGVSGVIYFERKDDDAHWAHAQNFPNYIGPFLREDMRFEVVE